MATRRRGRRRRKGKRRVDLDLLDPNLTATTAAFFFFSGGTCALHRDFGTCFENRHRWSHPKHAWHRIRANAPPGSPITGISVPSPAAWQVSEASFSRPQSRFLSGPEPPRGWQELPIRLYAASKNESYK